MNPGFGAYLFHARHSLHNLRLHDLRSEVLFSGYTAGIIAPNSEMIGRSELKLDSLTVATDEQRTNLEELAREAIKRSPTGVLFAHLSKPDWASRSAQLAKASSTGQPLYAFEFHIVPTIAHRIGTEQLMIKYSFGKWSP